MPYMVTTASLSRTMSIFSAALADACVFAFALPGSFPPGTSAGVDGASSGGTTRASASLGAPRDRAKCEHLQSAQNRALSRLQLVLNCASARRVRRRRRPRQQLHAPTTPSPHPHSNPHPHREGWAGRTPPYAITLHRATGPQDHRDLVRAYLWTLAHAGTCRES